MKKYFYLLVLLAYSVSAQDTYTDLVEYKFIQKVNNENVYLGNFFLLMNSKESFAFTYKNSKEDYSTAIQNFKLKKSVPRLQYNLLENNFIYSNGINNGDFFFYKDKVSKINWKIVEGEKEVLGFKCQKAIGGFRGRTYIVWFTTEIPYNYGPWKLNGLPGVILESTDEKELFIYKAFKISLNNIFKLPKEIEENWSLEGKVEPYSSFINKKEYFEKKSREQIIASYPKGAQLILSPPREYWQEKVFEWEKDKK